MSSSSLPGRNTLHWEQEGYNDYGLQASLTPEGWTNPNYTGFEVATDSSGMDWYHSADNPNLGYISAFGTSENSNNPGGSPWMGVNLTSAGPGGGHGTPYLNYTVPESYKDVPDGYLEESHAANWGQNPNPSGISYATDPTGQWWYDDDLSDNLASPDPPSMPPGFYDNKNLAKSLMALQSFDRGGSEGGGYDYDAYHDYTDEHNLPRFTYSHGPEYLFEGPYPEQKYHRLGQPGVEALYETIIPGDESRGLYGVQRHHMDESKNALAASRSWKEYLAGGPLKGASPSLIDSIAATYRSGSDTAGHYGSEYGDRLWSEQGVQGTMEDWSQYENTPEQTFGQWMSTVPVSPPYSDS